MQSQKIRNNGNILEPPMNYHYHWREYYSFICPEPIFLEDHQKCTIFYLFFQFMVFNSRYFHLPFQLITKTRVNTLFFCFCFCSIALMLRKFLWKLLNFQLFFFANNLKEYLILLTVNLKSLMRLHELNLVLIPRI